VQLDLPFARDVDPPSSRQSPLVQPAPSSPPAQGVEFVRTRRARRYILRVRPDGSLRVTVPRGGSRREAEAFVEQHARWIERERSRVRVEHAPVEWRAGSEILFRGTTVAIRVERQDERHVVCYGDRRIEVAEVHDLRAIVERDLRELAREELVRRLVELAGRHGLPVGRVSIRDQRSRWGSCARNGNIALNFRLVQMPVEVRDYVLVHELMHIRQQNHSRRFWKLVAAACPAFRARERWLRTAGRALF
jgi:predicted metal-dependent hydrolase